MALDACSAQISLKSALFTQWKLQSVVSVANNEQEIIHVLEKTCQLLCSLDHVLRWLEECGLEEEEEEFDLDDANGPGDTIHAPANLIEATVRAYRKRIHFGRVTISRFLFDEFKWFARGYEKKRSWQNRKFIFDGTEGGVTSSGKFELTTELCKSLALLSHRLNFLHSNFSLVVSSSENASTTASHPRHHRVFSTLLCELMDTVQEFMIQEVLVPSMFSLHGARQFQHDMIMGVAVVFRRWMPELDDPLLLIRLRECCTLLTLPLEDLVSMSSGDNADGNFLDVCHVSAELVSTIAKCRLP